MSSCALTRQENDDAASPEMGNVPRKSSGDLAPLHLLYTDNDDVDRSGGDECIRVRNYKAGPVALTVNRCPSLRKVDGFR